MVKEYTAAPLPFQGQKRRFASDFKKLLKGIDATKINIVVDLFGGSGLLAHIAKRQLPDATVIYNDFDNYRERLAHVEQTNEILRDLREILHDCPRKKAILPDVKAEVVGLLRRKEQEFGYIDCVTLSAALLFSGRYATNLGELCAQGMYNRVCSSNYDVAGYLDELAIVSCDYRELFSRYSNRDDVLFIIDPPYLSTDAGSYRDSYWRLRDYLDVLMIMLNCQYVYFSSSKSALIELCDWLASNTDFANPFAGCDVRKCTAPTSHNSGYTDIMLHNLA